MLKEKVENFFTRSFDKLPRTIAVAVSGGIDSLALTFILNKFCLSQKIKLYAITIDHRIRAGSTDEALQLSKILQKNKISHKILTIDTKKIPQKNIEAKLREIRYELLYNYCIENKVEHLFFAHHLNDAAENFLIRLFRGSQIDGLSGMLPITEFKKIKLCRPFLDVRKSELEEYLKINRIKHFEDESNKDEKFLRNKIRKFLSHLPESDLIQERIVNFSRNLFEIKQSEDIFLLKKAQEILVFQDDGSFIIDVEEYQKLPTKIAQKILSFVLIEISGNIYKPRILGLKNFEDSILALKAGKTKNFYGCSARYITKSNSSRILKSIDSKSATYFNIIKNPNSHIVIYRDNKAKINKSQKFDSNSYIYDGRFILKKDKKIFYFRTILGNIFRENNLRIKK